MSTVGANIEPTLKKRFEAVAKLMHVTPSALLRSLIVDCVAEEEQRAIKPRIPPDKGTGANNRPAASKAKAIEARGEPKSPTPPRPRPGPISSQQTFDEGPQYAPKQTKGDLRRMLSQAVANTPGARKVK